MKLDWKRLLHEPIEKSIRRGSLIKLKDDSWCDEVVIFMICEWIGDNDFPISIVRISGSKGGINPFRLIPATSLHPERSITVGWLIENWNDWIWMESDVSTAMICHGPISSDLF
ncbi:Imm45 family immunity protein [Marinobacterium iners]|uniref:Imm45 family immunity protein n=1 Tax=Marinobacterium iners TaxID=48076 RepID=UPI001114D961|nr:Imm45 family immunity protein [Marinobacterium iners]